ncbi:hypothetical protein [Ligilactobacillus acidipiscis]|uniref:hypothetical protein n=1 Tax=Ligilactobacillus acidipiscis TaxID=89059 RepID=UPI0023F77E67|nr:hypothetical protein [Ligilactobacillus acidipiscis]WEV57708.1 hypothetical protein OZX66_03955 [Ligilactobacillus acidipiscis]
MAKKQDSFSVSTVFLGVYEILMVIALIFSFKDLLTSSAKGDYFLTVVEIIAGILIGYLPVWIAKRLNIELPQQLFILYVVFLFGSIYLGTLRHFYRLPLWDKMLHLVSSSLEVCLGLAIFGFLLTPEVQVKVSRTFVTLYAFCFSAFCGVLWEFYEFTCDSFGMNLQRYMAHGQPKVGRAALMDTMTDLIADVIGALIFCLYLYFKFKKDPGSLKNFFFHKSTSEQE